MTIEKFSYPKGFVFQSSDEVMLKLSDDRAKKASIELAPGEYTVAPKKYKGREALRTLRVGDAGWGTFSQKKRERAGEFEVFNVKPLEDGRFQLKDSEDMYLVWEKRGEKQVLIEAYLYTFKPKPKKREL